MKSILKITFFAVAILMLTSCLNLKKTPTYKTEYTYIPPNHKTEIYPICLSQCSTAKAQCKQIENLRADMQLREVERKCREDTKGEPPSYTSQCIFMNKSRVNYGRCTTSYNACFTTCGGKITRKKVCIYNCNIKPKK